MPMRWDTAHLFAVVVRQTFREIVYGIGHCDRTLPHTVYRIAPSQVAVPFSVNLEATWLPTACG